MLILNEPHCILVSQSTHSTTDNYHHDNEYDEYENRNTQGNVVHHGHFIRRFSASQPLALFIAAFAGVPVEEGVVLEALLVLAALLPASVEQAHRCKAQMKDLVAYHTYQ